MVQFQSVYAYYVGSRLLPSFQLGSGVILTMVSYLAGSAQILQGPIQ